MSDLDWQNRIEGRLDDMAYHRRAMAIQIDSMARQAETHTEQIDSIRGSLEENTAATKKVADDTSEIIGMFQAFQGAQKVLEAIGKAAKPLAWVASVGTAVGAWWFALKGK